MFVTGQGVLRQKGELTNKAGAESGDIWGAACRRCWVVKRRTGACACNAIVAPVLGGGERGRTAEIAIYNREVLAIYARNEKGSYEERLRKELAGSDSGMVAFGGSTIVLGSADGTIRAVRFQRLEPAKSVDAGGRCCTAIC